MIHIKWAVSWNAREIQKNAGLPCKYIWKVQNKLTEREQWKKSNSDFIIYQNIFESKKNENHSRTCQEASRTFDKWVYFRFKFYRCCPKTKFVYLLWQLFGLSQKRSFLLFSFRQLSKALVRKPWEGVR